MKDEILQYIVDVQEYVKIMSKGKGGTIPATRPSLLINGNDDLHTGYYYALEDLKNFIEELEKEKQIKNELTV